MQNIIISLTKLQTFLFDLFQRPSLSGAYRTLLCFTTPNNCNITLSLIIKSVLDNVDFSRFSKIGQMKKRCSNTVFQFT